MKIEKMFSTIKSTEKLKSNVLSLHRWLLALGLNFSLTPPLPSTTADQHFRTAAAFSAALDGSVDCSVAGSGKNRIGHQLVVSRKKNKYVPL